jgi:hypothetical protein
VTDKPPIANRETGEVLDEERQIRPFAELLTMLDRGTAHAEASRGLADLVAAVRDTGKKGALAIAVEIAPLKGSANQVVVTAQVTVKLPKSEPGSGVFWVDDAGNLSRNDPQQLAFEGMRVVEPEPTRTVDTSGA